MTSGVNNPTTTPNIVLSVTYYLELRNAIIVHCMSHLLSTKVNFVV